MYYSIAFDVAGPELLVAAGVSLLCGGGIFMVLVTLLEAGILSLVRWDTFKRSIAPAFLMNFVTTLLGAVLLLSGIFWEITLWHMFAAFLVSTATEWGILMFYRRKSWGRTFIGALAANAASYIFLTLIAFLAGILR